MPRDSIGTTVEVLATAVLLLASRKESVEKALGIEEERVTISEKIKQSGLVLGVPGFHESRLCMWGFPITASVPP